MEFSDADGILTCPAWNGYEWQKHGFGTRVRAPFPALTLRQIHSADICIAGDFGDREREGDALVTNEVSRAIGVRTADCVPILLLDPRTRAVAAVHAGWRGTAACVSSKTIEKFCTSLGSRPEDLQAAIGPCIRACCYEVSEDVAARFKSAHVRKTENGRPHLDLSGANRDQLVESGLNREHVYDCGLCTYCTPGLFYSYRREPADPGRMLSTICRIA